MRGIRIVVVSGVILGALVLAWSPARAQTETPTSTPGPMLTMFGALSNFDVFNDTGQETHGFEIELDGLSSQDVQFTFGDPYQRYGNPKVVDFNGGVYVRYESPYDSGTQTFTQATPMAPSVITPTAGHACWFGGAPGYLTAGCEHFGVGLRANPTATVYRWLIADPGNPGALQPSGTKVSIPAPIWSVSPPPVGAPNPAPVVAAVIQAEPPEPGFEFGDAIWVKVFKTESPDPMELHHLVTDDPGVPQEQSETEVEWTLLQSRLNAPAQLENGGQIAEGNESVTRRYEFYQYTGAYDPENHEAKPVSDATPAEGDIGNYIGAQMAAINLGPAGPGPTATPTPNSTVTPTPSPCPGDCNGDGSVSIDEILTLVHIALGDTPMAACEAGAGNDHLMTVDDVLIAVHALLNGCPG